MHSDPIGTFFLLSFLIGLGIAAGIGAVVGAASYVVSEVISYAITGTWSWSWGMFLGSIIGSAVGGALSFAFPVLGIIGSAVMTGGISTALGMVFENTFNEADHSFGEILYSSFLSAAISGVFAGITKSVRIPGFTGRGSISQVARQISTKFYNGSIGHIRIKTLGKIFLYESAYSIFSTITSGIIDAIDHIINMLKNTIPARTSKQFQKFF